MFIHVTKQDLCGQFYVSMSDLETEYPNNLSSLYVRNVVENKTKRFTKKAKKRDYELPLSQMSCFLAGIVLGEAPKKVIFITLGSRYT